MTGRLSREDQDTVDAYIASKRAAGTYDTIDAFLCTMVQLFGREMMDRYLGATTNQPEPAPTDRSWIVMEGPRKTR